MFLSPVASSIIFPACLNFFPRRCWDNWASCSYVAPKPEEEDDFTVWNARSQGGGDTHSHTPKVFTKCQRLTGVIPKLRCCCDPGSSVTAWKQTNLLLYILAFSPPTKFVLFSADSLNGIIYLNPKQWFVSHCDMSTKLFFLSPQGPRTTVWNIRIYSH